MSNIDFRDSGMVILRRLAVRFHVAQHSFLTHMKFSPGSALAGVYQAGNERRTCTSMEDAMEF